MDLFQNIIAEPINLLPYDGIANYHGVILPLSEADEYFHTLLQTIAWKNDEALIYGKRIITKRKTAWYADKPYRYTYSQTTKTARPWTPELLNLKQRVEEKTGHFFNACLLNLYHDGSEGMTWHSDAEKALKKYGAIASVSLGAERKFAFKHKKTQKTESLMLSHGSLLVMKGETQTHWLHRLPTTTKVTEPRVNLTFRMMNN